MRSLLERQTSYGHAFLDEWRHDSMSSKLPNDSFFFVEGSKYVAINKTTSEVLLEEFTSRAEAEDWLESLQSSSSLKYDENYEAPVVKLTEWVTLKDLQAPAATSNFTKEKKKERQKLYGTENRNARLVNAEYSPEKDAMTFTFITTPTFKAHPAGYVPLKTDPDNQFAQSANPEKLYTLQIRILNFLQLLKDTRPDNMSAIKITWRELYEVLQVAYVQVHCNCPAHWWQGSAWYLTQLDGAIYPCTIAPKVWNAPDKHGDGNFGCKHLAALYSQIGFFRVQMASMAQKVLKAGGYI